MPFDGTSTSGPKADIRATLSKGPLLADCVAKLFVALRERSNRSCLQGPRTAGDGSVWAPFATTVSFANSGCALMAIITKAMAKMETITAFAISHRSIMRRAS